MASVLLLPRWPFRAWRLYNMADDPGETTDLSTKLPAILEELKLAWEDYAQDVGVIISN